MEDSNTVIAKPIRTDSLNQIVVNIIIPYKENYKGVQTVLENLQRIKNLNFIVTLVDDNSQNEHFANELMKLPGINLYRLTEDMGFSYCVNHAVKLSEQNICVILHSDVYSFEANAIRNLVLSLIDGKSDNVCMVSSTTDVVMPKECGFILRNCGKDDPYVLLQPGQFLPFHCCAISKMAFSKIGGLPGYKYCWFEDKLFALKAAAFGYNLAFTPRSFVRHKGGETIKQLIKSNSKVLEILKTNRQKFEQDFKVLDEFLKKTKS